MRTRIIAAIVGIVAAISVTIAPAANAGSTAVMCTAPGSGNTIVTTNYSYVRYLNSVGWRCVVVYPV